MEDNKEGEADGENDEENEAEDGQKSQLDEEGKANAEKDPLKMDPEEQEQLARQGTLVSSVLAGPSSTTANQLLSLLEEPFKKKRGRKPKKYYEQKALLEQTLAEQRAQQRADLHEIENEEEVLLRQDEYRKHPLFRMLQMHSMEL